MVDDINGYCQYLINLGNRPDPRVEVVVKPMSKRKSKSQRGYYRAVVVKTLSDFSGHDCSDIHDALKALFLSYTEGGITYQKSTEELNTAATEEYYEKIRRWADETLQVRIPLPNEVEYE